MFALNRLHFAAVVMSVVALLFLVSWLLYFFGGAGGAGKDIFETGKTTLPPIATLVLGYYFGQRESDIDDTNNPPKVTK